MSTRVLLVDDDRPLVGVLAAALGEEGYQVTQAHDGRAGLEAFTHGHFDVLILDVLMPELDGLELCRHIRQSSSVPIIFLTSRADEVDRINGLEIGADDYVVKPFSTRELVARIRALLRRSERSVAAEPVNEVLHVGMLKLDVGRFEATWNGRSVALTRSEFLVTAALMRNVGFVLSRDRLIDLACGSDVVITERTIDTFIKRIRQKFTTVDGAFEAIETVIGVGYRMRRADE